MTARRVTRIALTSLGLAQHHAPIFRTPAPFDEITPWDRVMARLDALKDVVSAPRASRHAPAPLDGPAKRPQRRQTLCPHQPPPRPDDRKRAEKG